MQRTQGSRGGHRRARDDGSGHGAPDLAGEGAEARRVGAAVALLVAGEADCSGRESAAANEHEAEEAGLATNEVRGRSGTCRWVEARGAPLLWCWTRTGAGRGGGWRMRRDEGDAWSSRWKGSDEAS